MKKLIPILIFLISISLVNAWIDCEPDTCPSGSIDNGTICISGDCYRQCLFASCDETWTEVYSEQFYIASYDNEESDYTSSYTANSGYCYEYKYEGGDYTYMKVDDDYDPNGGSTNCDSEAVIGFWQTGKPSNPWYKDLTDEGEWGSNYWGDVSHSSFDYFYVTNRAHTEDDSTSSYESDTQRDYSLYCAPNNMSCDQIGTYGVNCDTTCYGKGTYMHMYQGWVKDYYDNNDWYYSNDNLRYSAGCDDEDIFNYLRYPYYKVYRSGLVYNLPTEYVCTRINEGPNATNVNIIGDNVGDDLICDFDYYDVEGFEEKESIYEWYKNGVIQYISNSQLDHNNLSVGDVWSCSIIPSDGLANGTITYSDNITLRSTVRNPGIYIEDELVWNYSGYYSEKERNLAMIDGLNNILDHCIKDENGLCNISITFVSDAMGVINLSDLEIYQRERIPEITISEFNNNYSDNLTQGFKLKFNNTGDIILSDLTWILKTNDGQNYQGIVETLGRNQEVEFYFEHEFSEIGYYNINLTVSNNLTTQSEEQTIYVGDLIVSDIESLSIEEGYTIIKAKIENRGSGNLKNIDWQINDEQETISSSDSFDLNSGESALVFMKTLYPLPGTKTINVTTSNSHETMSVNYDVEITNPLDIIDFEIKSSEAYDFIFGLILNNTWNVRIPDLSWNITLGETKLSSQFEIDFDEYESMYYYLKHEFSKPGDYVIEINVFNDNVSQTKFLNLNVESQLNISDLYVTQYNQKAIYGLTVKNIEDWLTNLNNVIWTLDTGEGIVTNRVNLTSGEDVFIFVAKNYTKSNEYSVNASVIKDDVNDTLNLNVNVNPFDVNSNLIYESEYTKVVQIIVNNTWDIELNNIGWAIDQISSNDNTSYSAEEQVFHWIKRNSSDDVEFTVE